MTKQRRVSVVASVVHDDSKRFLVCFNRRWNLYAFPMKKTNPGDDRAEIAIQALNDHCPFSVTDPTATPLEHVGDFGPSWAVGQDTFYDYHVYEVKTDSAAGWPVGNLGDWCGFLDREQLLNANLVSWSTKAIVSALMDDQQVALAVICRSGPGGREFLLVNKPSYGGFFFPASRRKEEISPTEVAIEAVQSDVGFKGLVMADVKGEENVRQYSARYGCDRNFRFYITIVTLPPDVDLNAPGNPLETALNRNGIQWDWFAIDQLESPTDPRLSPTFDLVRLAVRAAIQ